MYYHLGFRKSFK